MQGREVTGKTLTGLMDARGEKLGEPAAYLTILESFRGARSTAIADHIFFSFLISGFKEILESNEVSVLQSSDTCILSGSLNRWVTFTERLADSVDIGVRVIVTQIYLTFKRLGLRGVWSERGLEETTRPDGTITFKKGVLKWTSATTL